MRPRGVLGATRRLIASFDYRKPVHLLIVGAILGGVTAPIAAKLMEEERYRVAGSSTAVLAAASPNLADKLVYDGEAKAIVFNRDGSVEGRDKLAATTGGGGKKSNQLYTASLPKKAAEGVAVTDNVHSVTVKLKPKFPMLDGRNVNGRVVYPLPDGGQVVYTPKTNSLKEDILLETPGADTQSFTYALDVPATLQARMMPDGGVGIYSGDPALFGRITYGTELDREKVEKARAASPKTYLMFRIPAPVIVQAGGKKGGAEAKFKLSGNDLTVTATGLAKASYPLSIDPTFVVTSSSDFSLGRAEDNIDFAVPGQIGRAVITGGSIDTTAPRTAGWTATSSINTCNNTNTFTDFNFGLTAYNGYLYLVGGGNGSSTFTCYVAINADGTLGTWTTATNVFANGRTGASVIGYNGYIYIMGGENANGGTQYAIVEYAKVQANGDLGVWSTTTSLNTGRAYSGAAVYNGVIYVLGGSTRRNNSNLSGTTEYAKINANGTLTAWTATNTFTTARNRFGVATYNNYIYVVGGFNGSAPLSDVQYAAINDDGTLGVWSTTSALPGTRRSHAVSVERGHLYAYGGCSTTFSCTGLLASTVYAPINTDGSVGGWDNTSNLSSSRFYNGGTSYNGVLYNVAGCTVEPTNNNNCQAELSDVQYAVLETPGGVGTPASSGTLTSARAGVSTLAYGGYLYSVGGCNGTSCGTYSAVAEYATLNDNGTLGTWTATTSLPAATGMNAGRTGGALAAIGGKLYYLGGLQKTTGAVDNYANTVFSTTPAANGPLGAWTQEANTFTNGRHLLAATVWNDKIYIVGGTNGATWYNDIQFATAAGGTLGGFSGTTSSFSTGRSAHGAVAYNGNMYVIGGQNSGGGLLSDVQRAAITSSGDITVGFTSDTALPAGRRFHAAVAHNSVLYVFGGMTGSAATTDILYAPLTGINGAVTGWSASPASMLTARWGGGATVSGGYIYTAGGCTSGVPPCTAYTTATEAIRINNGSTGKTAPGAWAAGSAFTTARADHMTVAYNGHLYVIGGCTAFSAGVCTAWTNSIQIGVLSRTGAITGWTSASLPLSGRSLAGAVAYNGKLYVVGGSMSGSAEVASVIYTPISATGTLGTWVDDPGNYLPAGRKAFGLVVSGGFVYVAGGTTGGGTVTNSVLFSAIDSDGDLVSPSVCGTTWCTSSNTFTTARQELQATSYNGRLYVVGGFNGSDNLSDVQFADLAADGSVGSFKYTTSQDRGFRAKSMTTANGYMYFFGSEASKNDVYYAAINANGTLGNLYIASSAGLPAANNHTHGSVVFYDGYFYALGGCTLSGASCTTVNATAAYTGQRATPRLAHYSKLFDTQVDTAPTQLMVNGSESSADSAIVTSFQTASTSDPVLGVPQVFNPTIPGTFYLVQALNSSGQNVGVAFNYLIRFTLDDSQSGAFPDTALAGNGTTVSDFTVFYHANPSRRLRHGASFTNTGCNEVPSEGCILDTAP